MGASAITGLAVVTVFVVAGMLFFRMLNRAVYPKRVELFEMAVKVINDPKAPAVDKAFVTWCMDHAMEFSGGWMILRAMASAIKRAGEAPQAEPLRCPRTKYVGKRFIFSALAINPIAFVATVPMLLVLMLVERQRVPFTAMGDAAIQLRANWRDRPITLG
ncbi:hypothetical protein [Sphingomonas sp.]|uniref:hypothetical protein n=1 Tax=Sphingomonas sp. TaxID=28214 RepID=UPI001B211818|nr:hypothetical protein [Sphingomonas sp.]MBO9715069.1 hypothetical protein [Sphingomonas sp.]